MCVVFFFATLRSLFIFILIWFLLSWLCIHMRFKPINSITYTCLLWRHAKKYKAARRKKKTTHAQQQQPTYNNNSSKTRPTKKKESSALLVSRKNWFASFYFVFVNVCVWLDIIVYCLIHPIPKPLPRLFSSMSWIIVCALSRNRSHLALWLFLSVSLDSSLNSKKQQQPTISTREKRQQSTSMHTCTHSISVVIYYNRWCIECEWSSLLKWARFDKYTYLYVRISKPKHSFNGERITMCMY